MCGSTMKDIRLKVMYRTVGEREGFTVQTKLTSSEEPKMSLVYFSSLITDF